MAFIGTAASAAASRKTTATPSGVSLKKLSPKTSAKNKRVLSLLLGNTRGAKLVAEEHYGATKKGGRKRRTSKKCTKHKQCKHKHSKHKQCKHKQCKHKHSKHKHSKHKHTRKCSRQ
jgi:hypothetical protein